ncbi:MAG: hypothetical protein WC734_02580 [Patescibacteria group bacterium]|jgi:hypothetical protein
MKVALVVLLVSVLFAGTVFAQSENSIAAANQAKALFLKQAGLPDNIYNIIGQNFTFFYDQVPAGWNSISGIVWGIDFRPVKEIDIFVSVPYINGLQLRWLRYKQEKGQWYWRAFDTTGTNYAGTLIILTTNPPARS